MMFLKGVREIPSLVLKIFSLKKKFLNVKVLSIWSQLTLNSIQGNLKNTGHFK